MDKNAIQKFAVWARQQLLRQVGQRAYACGVQLAGENNAVAGRPLNETEKAQRERLLARIASEGYDQVLEAVAYTWFNRLIALRFMEVNGYLPSHVRVFSDENDAFKPALLQEALTVTLPGLDRARVLALLDAQDDEALYRYLLITQCNALNAPLPGLFEKLENETELLLPDGLLRPDGVIARLVGDIPAQDWRDQVQIIGWLYQYYNSEVKEDTYAQLKKNVKVSRERVPAATQLFTPDWIVRYMVENSLGRLWLNAHPADADALLPGWRYYIPEAPQPPQVAAQLAALRAGDLPLQQIKLIDPCCGSGHILVYAFDLLLQLYTQNGWPQRDAVQSILQNNLFGLDIDPRAAQLAYFAVMMKARQYDRRFLGRGIQPQIYSPGNDADAREYGALLRVQDPGPAPQAQQTLHGQLQAADAEAAWHFRRLLAQQYDVVVTNPPYMGGGNMNAKLSAFVKKEYPDYKSDLFSAFIVRCMKMAKLSGYLGFFTPYVWMFISSYEKLRTLIRRDKTIETLIQFEYSAFEEATVPVCTFVLQNRHMDKKGCYLRLTEFRGGMEVQRQKTLEAIADHACGFYYEQSADNFSKIPGSPIAYWVSDKISSSFLIESTIGSLGAPKSGMQTGNNDLFLRIWYEVEYDKINFSIETLEQSCFMNEKWIPHPKGGPYRKWYGNLEYVVNFEKQGRELKKYPGNSLLKNPQFYFREGISWSHTTSKAFSARYMPKGCIFNVEAPTFYPNNIKDFEYIFGMLNTKVLENLFQAISETMHFMAGDIAKIPVIIQGKSQERQLTGQLVHESVKISKADWDAYETSWNFKKHPML